MKKAYKFTSSGRAPTHRTNDYPPVGEWSESKTPVVCKSGWHVPTTEGMSRWLSTELWEVEVDGNSSRHADKESWERIRFVRQVDEWTPVLASEFAAACQDRAYNAAANAAYAANDAARYAVGRYAAADAARYAATNATGAARYAVGRYAANDAADAAADAAARAEWRWQGDWLRTRLNLGLTPTEEGEQDNDGS